MEKRVYEGSVRFVEKYMRPHEYRIGQNPIYPQYSGASCFSLTKFLEGLENKRIKLTLEVIEDG